MEQETSPSDSVAGEHSQQQEGSFERSGRGRGGWQGRRGARGGMGSGRRGDRGFELAKAVCHRPFLTCASSMLMH